jgi:hypothetical protein
MKSKFLNNLVILRVIYAIVLFCCILSHLPFLEADSDLSIATGSRGAWIDEGLNTSQVRNYVNHNYFNLLDSDNLLKTPLFSLFLYPFFKFFGISMLGSRVITVFFCATLLLSFFYKKTTLFIGLIFVVTTMMFLPIHQYSHLCLAEMFSSMLIVISLLFYSFGKIEKKRIQINLFFLLLFMAVLFKIQFIYVLVIPLLAIALNYLRNKSLENRKQLFVAGLSLMILVAGILFVWLIPFSREWIQIAEQQSGSFSFYKITIDLIWANLRVNFLSKQSVLFTLFFTFSFFLALRNLINKQYKAEYFTLIVVSFFWFFVELHKLGYTYLPMRYLISFYLSMGFFASVVVGFSLSHLKINIKVISIVSIIALFSVNCCVYQMAFNSRTYVVKEMNSYVKKETTEKDIVIGPWAPAFTWESKCSSFPIWADFLAERDILEYYHPDFILSEVGEEDSGYAYKSNDICLDKTGDSIKSAKIALWNVILFKVRK